MTKRTANGERERGKYENKYIMLEYKAVHLPEICDIHWGKKKSGRRRAAELESRDSLAPRQRQLNDSIIKYCRDRGQQPRAEAI